MDAIEAARRMKSDRETIALQNKLFHDDLGKNYHDDTLLKIRSLKPEDYAVEN